MRVPKFLLIVLIPLLSSFYAHKYYLSVTELQYNEEENAIQIITRLFYDDLEAVLQERYEKSLKVNPDEDQEKLNKYLSKYITQKIGITVNGNTQNLNFLGKEYEDDYIVCYIEITGIEDIKTIEIQNTALMDLFEDQKNMVHTHILGKKKSLLLRDGKTKAVLNFSQ
jgi:hypothetical protein